MTQKPQNCGCECCFYRRQKTKKGLICGPEGDESKVRLVKYEDQPKTWRRCKHRKQIAQGLIAEARAARVVT